MLAVGASRKCRLGSPRPAARKNRSKTNAKIRILTSTDADTNVGWALRDQQPEETVQHSETEYRINNR